MAFKFCGFADEASRALLKQIEATKEAGWAAIELRLVDTKHVCDQTDAEWAATWATLQQHGIAVAGFGGQIANWARPISGDFQKDLDELRRVAPRMHQAGTKLLRIMSYPNDKDNPWPKDKWRDEVIRRLRELAKIAEAEGVILAHENCSGYGGLGPAEYMELVKAVNSPALKLIFDTGNNSAHDNDNEATWRYYQTCRKEIVHVHIKSYQRGADGKLVTCYPDQDPVQRRVLADLKATGYNGWISIEPHLAAAVHAGKDVKDEDKGKSIYVEYARRLTKLTAGL
jgi:sugar phosphate isomerase/epimerase